MEDGSLKAIGKDAERAAKGTDKATKSADKYSKKQKGVAGISSNSTKNFSKMTTGITGGLVPAYATLAANVFALTAAFGVLSRNDAISKLEEGLNFTGRAAGRSLTLVADKLKEITDNAISAEQAMRTTAIGVSAGFSQTQMEGLAKVAKGASLALGRDMADAMDRLTRGAAKLEPEILDELGIMVRLDDAVDNYARTMNKSVGDLTQFERRQAFTNAIIEDGRSKFDALAESVDASPYAQLAASFSDMTKTFIEGINSVFGPLLGFLAKTPMAFGALAAAFGASISKQMIGGLENLAKKSKEVADRTSEIGKIRVGNLKPVEHMGKAFNRLAGKVELTDDELVTMLKSSKMTVNMMNKSNPLLKDAIKTRGRLTRAVHLQTMAVVKGNAANAISMIQTHGLKAAFVELKATVALSGAVATGAAKGQDAYTAAVVRTRHALFALGSSAKFAGAAILTAMPYVAMAVGLLSLLVPLFQKFFGTEDTKLGKAIETNDKRLSDMGKTVKQWNGSIKKANSESDAWLRTLTPLSGMLTEAAGGMKDLFDSLKVDQMLRAARATEDLEKAQRKLAETRGNAQRGARTNVKRAESEVDTAGNATQEELNLLFTQGARTVQTFKNRTEEMRETLQGLADDGQPVGQALSVVTATQEAVNKAFEEFKKNKTEEGYLALEAAIKKQADSANAAVDATKSFNDTLAKAKDLVGNTTASWGVFGEEIDNVAEGLRQINAILAEDGVDAAEARAKKLLEAYGQVPKTLRVVELDEGGVTGRATDETYTETNIEAANRLKGELDDINKRYKVMAEERARINNIEIDTSSAKQVFEDNLMFATEAVELERERLLLAKDGSEKEHEHLLKVLELEKQRRDIIKERYNDLASDAKDSGMGAGTSAMIKAQGKVSALATADLSTFEGKTEEEQKENQEGAIKQARADQARESLQGIAQDIAAIGPEGALLSATLEGIENMTTSWSTAMEVMKDDSASMSTKVSAGLGALGATIGALGEMQKAASDQRVRAIDSEIAAEKNRDGKSAASMQKISALEKKKEAEKRKQFEKEKKTKIAQAIIGGLQGAIAAYTSLAVIPIVGPALGAAAAAAVLSMTSDNVAAIKATSYQGGGSVGGATKISAGSGRSNTVDLANANDAGGEQAYMRGAEGRGKMGNFKPAFSGYKTRAAGGFVVGEQGPELFMPDVPGEIIPSGQNVGGTTNVNFSINAVDATGVQELLEVQKGNIIGMIREAAHEHGEDFLEMVREDSL